MSLPYDVARCSGVKIDGEWREGCEHCDRCGKPLGGSGHIHTCTPKQPMQEHVIDCPRCGHCCPQS